MYLFFDVETNPDCFVSFSGKYNASLLWVSKKKTPKKTGQFDFS
jgi:hypothetical protein